MTLVTPNMSQKKVFHSKFFDPKKLSLQESLLFTDKTNQDPKSFSYGHKKKTESYFIHSVISTSSQGISAVECTTDKVSRLYGEKGPKRDVWDLFGWFLLGNSCRIFGEKGLLFPKNAFATHGAHFCRNWRHFGSQEENVSAIYTWPKNGQENILNLMKVIDFFLLCGK